MSTGNAHPPLIAIIEDEAPIRKFLRASLTAEGYRVEEAEDARSGIRLVTQYRADLVLLDLGLPDRDGKELVAEIRGWSTVPIVILSARDQEREKVEALDAGADDYLTKPFGVGELLARIRVALRHHAHLATADDEQHPSAFRSGPLVVDLLAHMHHVTYRGNVHQGPGDGIHPYPGQSG
jgi:two-component system, OmpR family, KDP operon response regulator KdpE